MSPVVVTTEIGLEAHECGKCGVIFGMTKTFASKRLEDKETFYCPNGHPRVFLAKSEAEKERERAEQYRRWLGEAEDRRRAEERRHAATKGQLTKTRKRVANGVCPCCHRSFVNVRRHMATKHPEFGNETGVVA